MKDFYDFNQRVRMRHDPSQFGRIGRGPFAELAAKSGTTISQFVFWEHRDADLVTCENVADLMSEEEYHERRRLFFAVMRHPEMHLFRSALWDLAWNSGVDWRTITLLEMERYGSNDDCWFLRTDHHMSICLDINAKCPDFLVVRLHDENDPLCDCDDCKEARVCHVHMKDHYIAQEQNASA